jgi:putative SOS response-associated peptidase YedK
MQKRRCLVPASGYYEWRTVPGPDGKPVKHPFYITPADGSVLAFAGLWEFWRSPEGEPLTSVTIITTDAVGDLRGIHDRMPLILPAAEWDAWLNMDKPATAVAPLLESPDPKLIEQLELRPVSSRVGNVRNDDPSLLARVAG